MYRPDGTFGPFHERCLKRLVEELAAAGFEAIQDTEALDPRLPAFVVSGRITATDLSWEVFDYGANFWSAPPRAIEERFEEWDYGSPEAFYAAFTRAIVASAIAFRDRAA